MWTAVFGSVCVLVGYLGVRLFGRRASIHHVNPDDYDYLFWPSQIVLLVVSIASFVHGLTILHSLG